VSHSAGRHDLADETAADKPEPETVLDQLRLLEHVVPERRRALEAEQRVRSRTRSPSTSRTPASTASSSASRSARAAMSCIRRSASDRRRATVFERLGRGARHPDPAAHRPRPEAEAARPTPGGSASTSVLPGSGGPPTGSVRSNATSNARSCGGGRPASEFRSIPSRRSTSVPNDSRVSATLARLTRTRSPRVRAAAMPASHGVVLPIPGPPLKTSPRAWPLPATNSCRDASARLSPDRRGLPGPDSYQRVPPPRG
jgi:hypothetical protein